MDLKGAALEGPRTLIVDQIKENQYIQMVLAMGMKKDESEAAKVFIPMFLV